MGVPYYFLHIIKKYPSIIKKINDLNINNLYLDSNSIIYDIYNNLNINNYETIDTYINDIYLNVCKKIDELINELQPKNKIYITFDGVAPVAKLKHQRTRRFKSNFTKELYNNQDFENYKENVIKTGNFDWSTINITPGTEFMNNLDIFINDYYKNNKKIMISGSNEVGEGEHKIFSYIRNNKQYHKNTKTVIYGLDSDLIMLSLNHLYCNKEIYLYRETLEFINNINKDLSPENNYVLNIKYLCKLIIDEMSNYLTYMNINSYNLLTDYILICFLIGNDFVYHNPSLNIRNNGITKMLNIYKEVCNGNYTLTENGVINWKHFKQFIKKLALQELANLKEEYEIKNNLQKNLTYKIKKMEKSNEPKKTIFDFKLNNLPSLERNIENYINVNENGWEYRYYSKLFDVDVNNTRLKEICINYLESLDWTFKYYQKDCLDYRWYYKYNYAPLFSDLVKYIPEIQTDFINLNPERPISNKVQLAYVLPKKYLYLLGKNIEKELLKKYENYYDEQKEIIWAWNKYFWQSNVVFNNLNIEELEKTILNIELNI
jgi:5'-3' exonuclease